jgi:tRNA pseudouridine55 synthase
MPKAALPNLPVSALFGITKPSGPTSMAIINDLKRLINASRLFADSNTAKENAERAYAPPGEREEKENGQGGKGKWSRGKKRRKGGSEAKIGQGGTLDPLADGVLGMCLLSFSC